MVNKSYTVVSGTFRGPGGQVTGQGERIELPADIAERFRHQLKEVKVEAVTQPGQGKVARKGPQAEDGGSD